MDEIPYDQEVIHVSHGMDHVQLILQSGLQRAVVVRVMLRQSVETELVQISPGVVALRHIVPGQLRHAELDLHVAALGDIVCVVDRFGSIGEEFSHLLLGLAVVLAAFIPHAVFIGYLLTGLNTQKDIVRCGVLRKCIMNIIGRNQLDAGLPAHAQ